MPQSSIIKGEAGKVAQVDGVSGALLITELAWTALNNDRAFVSTGFQEGVVDDGTFEMLFRVPAGTLVYGVMDGACSGDCIVEFFEGPTVTAEGTPALETSRNRVGKATPTTTVFFEPTTSADGVPLISAFAIGGALQGRAPLPTSFRVEDEWVLEPDQDYLLRVTNKSGVAAVVSTLASWLEFSNPPELRVN